MELSIGYDSIYMGNLIQGSRVRAPGPRERRPDTSTDWQADERTGNECTETGRTLGLSAAEVSGIADSRALASPWAEGVQRARRCLQRPEAWRGDPSRSCPRHLRIRPWRGEAP